jgi:hypothetical protein
MSAPVVEAIGGAFKCYPHFFENQMNIIGFRDEKEIDETGLQTRKDGIAFSAYKGMPQSTSEVSDRPYFSLPFRRKLGYSGEKQKELHQKQRTMFREYLEEELITEERVLGTLHSNGRAKVGK